MSIKEIQDRHDALQRADGTEFMIEGADNVWTHAYKDRGELLDALKEIGELADKWLKFRSPVSYIVDSALQQVATEIKAILDKL